MERNPNYWNKGLPYVDKLEIYNLPPFSPELGSSFLLRQGRLRAAPGSGLLAQGQGDAGRHRGRVQPVGHPGVFLQHEEASRSRTRACAGPCTWPSTGTCWSTW